MISRMIPRTTQRVARYSTHPAPGATPGTVGPGAPGTPGGPGGPKRNGGDNTLLYIAGAGALGVGLWWYYSKPNDPVKRAGQDAYDKAADAANAVGREAERAGQKIENKYDEVKRDIKRAT